VILHSTFYDPDLGASGQVEYKLTDPSGNTVMDHLSGQNVSPNSDAAYTVPSGTLRYDTTYTLTARAWDQTDYSKQWSAPILYFYGDWPIGSTANTGAPNFVVQCAYGYDRPGDPLHGYDGNSHDHAFFGNDRTRTDLADTTTQQEDAVVKLDTEKEDNSDPKEATFTLLNAVEAGSFFNVGDLVRVQDSDVTGYNGTWQVKTVATDGSKFTAKVNDSLPGGGGGTAGEAGTQVVGLAMAADDTQTAIATFTAQAGYTVLFNKNQKVVVQGVHINGNNGTGYNGTWLVTDVDTNGTWFKANVGDGTLDSGTVCDRVIVSEHER